MDTCGLWSVVTSWIKSFPGMSSTLQLFRTIPETCPKNNNCANFCWNEMFYQEIRQMSQLPPKSRWWGMGPLKRIREIWLESRKSLFAKKENLLSKPENKRERKMRTARRTNQREIRSESGIYGGSSWSNAKSLFEALVESFLEYKYYHLINVKGSC